MDRKGGILMESVYWLILLACLLLFEMMTLGLTTIWFASGAFLAFVVAMLGGSAIWQWVVFFAVSFCLLYFTRPIALKYFNGNRVKTNYEELIGKEAEVVTMLDHFHTSGTVVVNGLEWRAKTKKEETLLPGQKVEILEVQGVTLIVQQKKEA